jgi:RNase adapter protein RapZ
MHIVIVTGLSGAGKSTALRALEDYGFYCVDNLPLPLASQLVDWMATQGVVQDLALAIDARQQQYMPSYGQELRRLTELGHEVRVLYLTASDDCLVRRFSATRRLHPLSGHDLIDGIRRDHEILDELRNVAEVIDTTQLNVHQLKAMIQDRYGHSQVRLSVVLLSFGFKNGLPPESNVVFDVRFLPNPYFDPRYSDQSGLDAEVAKFVLAGPEARALLDHAEALLRFSLPLFARERKLYLTVAVGCTGGRHRSVAVVEELASRVKHDWDVVVKHRDLDLRT